MKRGSDVCYCGDYRSQHDGNTGRCRLCYWNGPYSCEVFKLSHRATKEEAAHWAKYHGKRKRLDTAAGK